MPDVALAQKCRLAVLASHRGTNFQAIIDACSAGILNAEVVVAISNNSNAQALVRAANNGIPIAHLSSKTYPQAEALDCAMLARLKSYDVSLVVTAGYLKKLGAQVLHAYKGRIINIHPSLLPAHGGKGMFGSAIHKAVIKAGDRKTGITIHHVDEDYDTGEIISQVEIDVRPEDSPESLAERVIQQEHILLINTLRKLTEPTWNQQQIVK